MTTRRLVNVLQWAMILCLLTSSAAALENDWLIVPGQRVGPITAQTTRAQLDQLFGKENVEDGSFQGEDLDAATVIYGNDRSAALAVTWDREHVATIHICFGTQTGPCRWRTASGIRIGLPIRELTKLNGKAFQMAGFGFDGQGAVTSWRKGALEEDAAACGHLLVRLLPEATLADRNFSKEEETDYKGLQGDKNFSSSTVPMLELNPRVASLEMVFTGPSCLK